MNGAEQVPSAFGPGFTYPASSLFVVTFNLAMSGTKKCSDVTLGPSKHEEEDSLPLHPHGNNCWGVTGFWA